MPSDRPFSFSETSVALLKEYFKTAELFGEEEFLIRKPEPVPSVPPPVLTRPESKGDRLERLYKKYENCQNCRLGKTRTKIVFGMGSLDPEVLLVGEGPGFDEDRSGQPFVGKSGQLLDKILAAIQLDRKKVYITNIVKCHPLKDPARPQMRGNDRPPDPSEIESCRAILDEQIEILDPPVLCTLGTTAAKTLLRTASGITALRGKSYPFRFPVSAKTVPLIPTYHPAALLRNEALKKEVWQDMKLLKKILADRRSN